MPCVAHTCLQRRVAVVEVRLMRIHTIQECFLCIRVYTTVQLSLYTDGVVGRLTLRVPNETAQQSGGRRGPAKVLEPDREARHPTRLVGRSYEWSGRPVHAQRQDTDRSVPMAPSHGQDSAIPHPPRRAVARWRRTTSLPRHSHARRETPTYLVALRHYAVVLAPSFTYMNLGR
jgi:hypothetical protein